MKEDFESDVFAASHNFNIDHYNLTHAIHKGITQDWGARSLAKACHQASRDGGWHSDPITGEEYEADIPRSLMLIVSEIAEAMEGDRKDLMDDKLPQRKMLEVELADAVIRIFDLGGKLKLDIVGAMIEKMAFNKNRSDHKIEERNKDGGKKY